jgi:hypothetical protein
MHGWAPEVIGAIGKPQTSPEQYLDIFFARSPASRQAGQQAVLLDCDLLKRPHTKRPAGR